MPVKALALKEYGSDSPSEGVLARFAQIRPIASAQDIQRVKDEHPDVILMDLRMPDVDGVQAVELLRQSRPAPVMVLFDSKSQPTALLKQLNALGSLKASVHVRSPNLTQALRLFGISQEALSRILNVSARTVHRWLQGTRPRRSQELTRFFEIVGLLSQALPSEDAVRMYLHHNNPALQGERPIELLIRGDFDRVVADLQAIQEGVYL